MIEDQRCFKWTISKQNFWMFWEIMNLHDFSHVDTGDESW
jgi:hypothetical protein